MSNSRSEHDSGLNEFLEDVISLFRLPKLRDSDHFYLYLYLKDCYNHRHYENSVSLF